MMTLVLIASRLMSFIFVQISCIFSHNQINGNLALISWRRHFTDVVNIDSVAYYGRCPLDHILKVILKKRKNDEEWIIRRKLPVEQKAKKLKSYTPSIPFYVAIFDRARSVRKKRRL